MRETISVKCPQCGASLKLKNRDATGKRVPCPKCKKQFVVTIPQADDETDFMSTSEPDDEFATSENSAAATVSRPPVKLARTKPPSASTTKQPLANNMKAVVLAGSFLVVLALMG